MSADVLVFPSTVFATAPASRLALESVMAPVPVYPVTGATAASVAEVFD